MIAPRFTGASGNWPRLARSPLADIGAFVLLLGCGLWFFADSTANLGYHWQWYQVPKYLVRLEGGTVAAGPLLQGLLVTLHISAISLLLCFAIGLTTALMRLSRSFAAHLTARVYLETIRNTPLLIQLFFIYFVVGPVLGISRFSSAVLALSLFEGAYASEIIRAGIVSIHRGQWEAARSLGLNAWHVYRHVVLPQALRRILPPLTSQAISLVKDSALVSTIAIYDLTMQTKAIISDTFLTFELWFTTAAVYLAITATLSLVVEVLETRLKAS
jgi:polar amino acid transport system permease protein